MGDAYRPARLAPVTLFQHFADAGNVSTGETDLYSDTIAAGQLASNGESLRAEYSGNCVSGSSRRLRIYFGGTAIIDTGNLAGISWSGFAYIIRVSATVVRASGCFWIAGSTNKVYNTTSEITGLDLTATNILKITGLSTSATDDVIARFGVVQWIPAA